MIAKGKCLINIDVAFLEAFSFSIFHNIGTIGGIEISQVQVVVQYNEFCVS